jgi:hypothetical protein
VGLATEVEREVARAAAEPAGPTRLPVEVRAALASPARDLDGATRAEVEPVLAHDLGRVRVHDDVTAAAALAAVGARGLAVGKDIVLPPDAPRSLVAHELAHVVTHSHAGPGLQRDQLAPPVARKALLATATTTFAAPTKDVTANELAATLNRWYRAITDLERTIATTHAGDATLQRDVRALYVAGLRALVPLATTSMGLTADEIYARNSGRIPMWAWPTPHQQVAGTSTPVAEGLIPGTGGAVAFPVGGVRVRILPDATDPKLGKKAQTKPRIRYRTAAWKSTDRVTVTSIGDPPAPVLTIQTFYGPESSASVTSGYGRGTTTEDLAGAKVDPRSRTLGFHEGSHGLDFVRYLRANPPPAYPLRVGMPVKEVGPAIEAWKAKWTAYVQALEAASEASTDMVGTPKP